MKIISIHTKRSGRKEAGYVWTPPERGKKRVMAIVHGKTVHIDAAV